MPSKTRPVQMHYLIIGNLSQSSENRINLLRAMTLNTRRMGKHGIEMPTTNERIMQAISDLATEADISLTPQKETVVLRTAGPSNDHWVTTDTRRIVCQDARHRLKQAGTLVSGGTVGNKCAPAFSDQQCGHCLDTISYVCGFGEVGRGGNAFAAGKV